MNKKQLHHLWTRLRPIKVWYLVALLLVLTLVSALALRQNNLRMVELRNAVYQADESGGDVEGAMQRLRAHVYAHMNTNLASGDNAVYPPIQLKFTYERLVQAEKQRVQQDSTRVYTDAQNYCERQNSVDFSGRNRVPCIQAYVEAHKTAEQTVPDALYKFDFVSPSWSPDLAGFSTALAVLLLLLLVIRITAGYLLKRASK